MLNEFKEFAMKGNVLDMAIGVIIGAAFGKIVTSMVSDILMPPIGLLMGKVDFASLFITLSGQPQPSLAAAKAAGTPTINYGVFLQTILDFVIVAFVVFLLVLGAALGGLRLDRQGIGKQRGDGRAQHARQRRLQRRKRIDLQEQGKSDVLSRGHSRVFRLSG